MGYVIKQTAPQVHDFKQSLAWSHKHSDAPWWENVYRQAFPNFLSMQSIREDGWAQRGGIDRLVTLKSGKVIKIDEKVRGKDYPDVLLETWSSREHKRPGWIEKDLDCDYIAYAYVPSQTCLLLPFLLLRAVWIEYGAIWKELYGEVPADNRTYTTISVPVPRLTLTAAMRDYMEIHWTA
jgi:hypothetical protein